MSSFPVSQERNAFQEQLHSLLQANYLAIDSKGKPTAISFAQSLLEKGKALMDPNACNSFSLNEAIVDFLSANQKLYHATNIAEVKKLAEKANLHTSSNEKHKQLYHRISLSHHLAQKILTNQSDAPTRICSTLEAQPLQSKKVKNNENVKKGAVLALLLLGLYAAYRYYTPQNHCIEATILNSDDKYVGCCEDLDEETCNLRFNDFIAFVRARYPVDAKVRFREYAG